MSSSLSPTSFRIAGQIASLSAASPSYSPTRLYAVPHAISICVSPSQPSSLSRYVRLFPMRALHAMNAGKETARRCARAAPIHFHSDAARRRSADRSHGQGCTNQITARPATPPPPIVDVFSRRPCFPNRTLNSTKSQHIKTRPRDHSAARAPEAGGQGIAGALLSLLRLYSIKALLRLC